MPPERRQQRRSQAAAAAVVQLPVTEARAAIVRLIRKHTAVVLVGETGSGKTTQIPQYVWDDLLADTPTTSTTKAASASSTDGAKWLHRRGIVGCTQPRRVAAISIARHVAALRGGAVGGEVAYAVRFDDTSTPRTCIKYMTDGILLREIQGDPLLRRYGVILLDEAHERTLHGDVLFGLLKDIVRKRREAHKQQKQQQQQRGLVTRNDNDDDSCGYVTPLKVVVMSATLNAEHFSRFWWDAPIGVVHGRVFPVTIYHTVEPQADYVEAAVSTILQLHTSEPCPGDVLCFLTGQDEIEDAKRILEQRVKLLAPPPSSQQQQQQQSTVAASSSSSGAAAAGGASMLVLTLYAAMPYEQQMRVFDATPPHTRKVILATNIAETSITVEGVKYVVDCGVVKAKHFNSATGIEALTEVDVSRAQAMQRAGRAGRVAAGKCYRLYTAAAFAALREDTVPEIRRSSLMSVVLQMKALHIDDILGFDFMDAPPRRAVVAALETLLLLGAVDRGGAVTALGLRLLDFPLEPMAARVLLAGKAVGVAHDAVAAVAMTTTENVFATSRQAKAAADRCRSAYARAAGDHVTLLNIYHAYCRVAVGERASWCERNALSHRQMLKVEDVVTQLTALLATPSLSAQQSQQQQQQRASRGGSRAAYDAEEALLAQLRPATAVVASSNNGGGGGDNADEDMTRKRRRSSDDDDDNDGAQRTQRHDEEAVLTGDFARLRYALCAGYFLHAAYYNAKLAVYQTVLGHLSVHVHPSSVLFAHRRKPALVLFDSVVHTTRRYMKDVTVVSEDMLRSAAPLFLTPAT